VGTGGEATRLLFCFLPFLLFDDDAIQHSGMTRLTIRIDFDDGSAIGPGKVKLLEQLDETGSIRKAAAAMKMSYRRAWLLLQALEETFGAPVATTVTGGKAGGGARLSPLGRVLVAEYRAVEQKSAKAAATPIAALAKRAGRKRRSKK
jgi:molybdate transport system regulatory protein